MISGLFKLIFYVFIAYLIYLVVRFLFSPRRRARPRHPPRQLSGTMVKDEICNTYLPQEDAIREEINGKDHFFCCEECRQKFLARKKSRKGDSSG